MENKTLQQILNEIKQMQASMNISSTITSEEIEAIAKELNNTIGVEIKSNSVPIGTNALQNISNFINDDHKKIKK